MKKILSVLFVLGFLVITLSPLKVLAQPQMADSCTVRATIDVEGLTCPGVGEECLFDNADGYDCALCCTLATVSVVSNWIFYIITLIVIIFILIGAFTIITSAGDEEKLKKGRDYVIYAMVGIAVAILARAIPWLAASLLGTT